MSEEVVAPVEIETPEQVANKEALKKEKENYKKRALEAEERLKKFEEQTLIENNKTKELAEFYKKENDELKGRIEHEEKLKISATKISTVIGELEKMGLKKDRKEAAMRLVAPEMEKLKFDPETRTVLGAEMIAKAVKDLSPELFGGSTGGVPDQSTGGVPAKLDHDSWVKSGIAKKSTKDALAEGLKANGLSL